MWQVLFTIAQLVHGYSCIMALHDAPVLVLALQLASLALCLVGSSVSDHPLALTGGSQRYAYCSTVTVQPELQKYSYQSIELCLTAFWLSGGVLCVYIHMYIHCKTNCGPFMKWYTFVQTVCGECGWHVECPGLGGHTDVESSVGRTTFFLYTQL